jgi:hypothetical protein
MKKKCKSDKKKVDRWVEAQKDYSIIEKELKPFLKKKKFREHSTAGEWIDSSALNYTK